jgi:DNA-3-methyladenine glycosylase II
MASARSAKDAFVERFGGSLEVDGTIHRAFPEPADVAGLTQADLLPVIRNDRRAGYLANVIAAWQEVDERWLSDAPLADVEAWLRSIKGVGEWSAAFVLFRGLGRIESMPTTAPFMRAVRAVYGPDLDEDGVRRLADGYGSWVGYWTMYLRAGLG